MADHVTQQQYDERVEICKRCTLWDQHGQRCRGCGCFMLTKARWSKARCPLDLWPAEG
ncbi:MAG: DUF6171 family protein [Synechococcus sp.]